MGRDGKGREGKGREGKGKERKGRARSSVVERSVDLPFPEEKHSSDETPLRMSVSCLYVRSLLDDTLG